MRRLYLTITLLISLLLLSVCPTLAADTEDIDITAGSSTTIPFSQVQEAFPEINYETEVAEIQLDYETNSDKFVKVEADDSGNLIFKALQSGVATVKATYSGANTTTHTYNITITEITITPPENDITLKEGKSTTIEYKVTPETVVDEIKIDNNNSDAIELTDSEHSITIEALAKGQATITITARQTDLKINVTVTSDKEEEKITLDPQSITGRVGTVHSLKADVTGVDTAELLWTSGDNSIASVEASGTNSVNVTLLRAGNTEITVTDTATQVSSKATVVVTQEESVSIKPSELTLSIGEEGSILAEYNLDIKSPTISWSVNDSNIVSVTPLSGNQFGAAIVKGLSSGQAIVTATIDSKQTSMVVTVTKPETITISPETLELNKGDSSILSATVESNQSAPNVIWHSSDSSIIALENTGNTSTSVRALAKGTASIKAYYNTTEGNEDKEVFDIVQVTVKDPNENINPENYRDSSNIRYGRRPYRLASEKYDTLELKVPTKVAVDSTSGGNNFVIAGYIKTDNVFSQEDIKGLEKLDGEVEPVRESEMPNQGAYITVENKDGNVLTKSELHNETSDWKPFLLPFTSTNLERDGNTYTINVVCHLGSTKKRSYGTAWFDIIGILPVENGSVISQSSDSEIPDLLFPSDSSHFYLENHQINLFEVDGFNTISNPIKGRSSVGSFTFETLSQRNTGTTISEMSHQSGTNSIDITGLKEGSDLMAIYATSGGRKYCDFAIINISGDIPSLTATPEWLYLDLDRPGYSTGQITIDPDYSGLKYESGNTSIATVDSNGLVIARAKGSTNIKVSKGSRVVNVEVVVSQEDQLINTVKDEIEIAEPYYDLIKPYLNGSDDKVLNVKDVESIENIDDLEIMGQDEGSSSLGSELVSAMAVGYSKPSSTILKERGNDLPFDIVNFIRAAHKLDPIVEKPDFSYTHYAQAGADYLASNDITPISHTAAKHDPSNPDADRGLQNSNLTSRKQSNVSYYPNEMIYAFLIDKGNNNLQTAGHRRWLLNDKAKFMGFGQSKNSGKTRADGALYVVDESAGIPASKVVSFPPAGQFPVELISEFYNGYFTWSIMFGDMYTIDNPANVHVYVMDNSGNTKELPRVDNPNAADGNWFTIIDKNLGSGKGINLNPAFVEEGGNPNSMIGKTYHVRVTGLNGVSSELNYDTSFFSLKDNSIQNYTKADKVTISPTSLELVEGDFGQLRATVSPSNASVKNPTWTTSDNNIVKVDQNGRLQAVSTGTAQITAKVDNAKAICNVRVVDNLPSKVEIVQGQDGPIKLEEGDSLPLSTKFDSDSKESLLTYKSSNDKIATVDQNGNVKAISPGKCQITVTTENGLTDTIEIEVVGEDEIIKATSIKISPKPINLVVGRTQQVAVIPSPEGSTIKYHTVIYKVADPSIATVSANGLLVAKAPGKTTLTATEESGLKDTSDITVVATPVDLIESLQITPEGPLTLQIGETKTLTASLSDNSIDPNLKWTSSNNGVVTVAAGANNTAVIKGISSGQAIIRASTTDGGAYDQIAVAVGTPGINNSTNGGVNNEGYTGAGGSDITLAPGSTIPTTGQTLPGNGSNTSTDSVNYQTLSTNTINTTKTSEVKTTNPKTGIFEDSFVLTGLVVLILTSVITLTSLVIKKLKVNK